MWKKRFFRLYLPYIIFSIVSIMVFAVAAHFLPGLQDANVGIGKGIVGIQSRQGITISAPEEIAYINGFITTEQLLQSAALYGKSPYGEHLKAVAEGRVKY